MSTNFKIALIIFFALGLLFWRLSSNFSSTNSDQVSFTGEVSNFPYVTNSGLTFQAGKYTVSSAYTKLGIGDVVKVEGKLEDRKVVATLVEKQPKPWWQQQVEGLRGYFKDQIYGYFPNPQASLLAGITLGENLIPKDFKENLIATGTIHVVVVSGYNIALVGSFFLIIAPYLGRRKTTLLAMLAIICYTILVGLTAPTLRSAVMGVITLGGIMLGKRTIALYLLLLTAWLMLVLNPSYLTDISFQLTFLATLGVLTFSETLTKHLKKVHPFFRESLATTLSAQVLVIPVLFFYFGTVSLSAPVVNSLVLWVVPIITLLGFIFLVLSSISIILGQALSLVLMLPLTFFTQAVNSFAEFKFLLLNIEPNNLFLLSGYYLLMSSLILNRKTRQTRKQKVLMGETGEI